MVGPAFFIFESKTHKPIQTVIRPNPILPTQTFLGPEPDFTYTNVSDAPNPTLPTQTFSQTQNCIGLQTTQKQPQILRLIFSSKSKSFTPADTKSRFFPNVGPENLACDVPGFFHF